MPVRADMALRAAMQDLQEAGIHDAQRDARRLLAFAMGVPAERLSLHLDAPLSAAQSHAFAAALAARKSRQPVAQITGIRQFWQHEFRVTPDVLDPRPETETLVAEALSQPFQRILDLGTGSGCILLSCLAAQPAARGVGVDISLPALEVARANAARLGLTERVRLLQGDWFSGVEGAFDLIVSNPPYIAESELAGLAPEVRDWEPLLALSPGADGLGAYRAIAAGVGRHLAPGGRLLLEIGPTQAGAVVALLAAAGLSDARILPDLDGRDRVVCARTSP